MTSLFGLESKRIFVLGGGQGMGEATVRLLASLGAHVAVVDREAERAERVAETVSKGGGMARAYALDVLDDDALIAEVARIDGEFGPLDGMALVIARAVEGYNPHAGFRTGARQPLMRAYKTQDGRWIQLMLLAPDRPWPQLCAILELPELVQDPRFATSATRIENGTELCQLIDARIGSRSWEDWSPKFLAWDAPWELIRTIHELGDDTQLQAAGTVFPMTLANGVKVEVVAGPIGFDMQCAPSHPIGSPGLGEHNDEVLSAIGCSPEELTRLRDAQVLGR